MDKYIKYDSISELHTELTNILLLCLEDNSTDYYCDCGEEKGDCELCKLIEFLAQIDDRNLIDGLRFREFLQVNYNNREKLEECSVLILPFFQKMELNQKDALEFFQRSKYTWSTRDSEIGIYHSLTLEEFIESDKELFRANPHLFDK